MTHETDKNENGGVNRRSFLALGATAGAVTFASALAEPTLAAPQGDVSKVALIKPKPLPDKIFTTEAVGITRKTHEEHHKLYTGYVNKVNEIRTKLAAMGIPDPMKANATYSDLRELKVEYSFALGGVKNHELYFGHLGGKGRRTDRRHCGLNHRVVRLLRELEGRPESHRNRGAGLGLAGARLHR